METLLDMKLRNQTKEHAKKLADTMATYKLVVANEKSLDSKLKSKMTRQIRNNLKYYIDKEITTIEFDYKARRYTFELYFNIYSAQQEIYATIEKLEYVTLSNRNGSKTVVFDIYNS